MNIEVASALATGATELAAFDNALLAAGVGNFNLIYLSSVIPPGSTINRVEKASVQGGWGDRLYCVMAQHRTSIAGQGVWAGIGWVQEPTFGQGLFAESHGHSEAEVVSDLHLTLDEMASTRRDWQWDAPRLHVIGGSCESKPVCALVVATYESDSWKL